MYINKLDKILKIHIIKYTYKSIGDRSTIVINSIFNVQQSIVPIFILFIII